MIRHDNIKVTIEYLTPSTLAESCDDILRSHTVIETGEYAPDVVVNAVISIGTVLERSESDESGFFLDFMKEMNTYLKEVNNES